MIPLIVFCHLPKTAGSTINAHLARLFPGQAHAENLIANEDLLRAAANQYAWISGHVDRDTFLTHLLRVTNRPLRVFSLIREPTAQVMSHYNWMIEIYHRGSEFYERHNAQIKAASATIRGSDFWEPDTIIELLTHYSPIFLNYQSRFIAGDQFDGSPSQIKESLKRYELVATQVDTLYTRMTTLPIEVPLRENESQYHFEKTVFAEEPVKSFLAEHNSRDELLYQLVTEQEPA